MYIYNPTRIEDEMGGHRPVDHYITPFHSDAIQQVKRVMDSLLTCLDYHFKKASSISKSLHVFPDPGTLLGTCVPRYPSDTKMHGNDTSTLSCE